MSPGFPGNHLDDTQFSYPSGPSHRRLCSCKAKQQPPTNKPTNQLASQPTNQPTNQQTNKQTNNQQQQQTTSNKQQPTTNKQHTTHNTQHQHLHEVDQFPIRLEGNQGVSA
jgi:hypothetical protein